MMENRVKKRLFLGLALGALLVTAVFISVFWYLTKTNAAFLNRLLVIAGWAAVVLGVCSLAGIALMVISLFYSRSLGVFRNFAFRMLDMVYPLALGLAKTLRLDRDLVRRSYVEVHNQATKFCLAGRRLKRPMILAPHCLQWSDCPYKITIDINNCRRCGRCPVDRLISLRDRFGAKLAIVTGGTLAREEIENYRPDAVLAIACEWDLISGIQDVKPLSVIGVLNDRPNGPCHNTQVDFNEVEWALRQLVVKPGISPVVPVSFSESAD